MRLKDFSRHPCFNAKSRAAHGRIHLPVAPKCNVQCNFCDRKYCCVNESRPGVSAAVLSPASAMRYLEDSLSKMNNLSVVGIAGPGDPFANPEETLATLRLVKNKYPDLLLCVSSNGLNLAPYVRELADLGVSHVTVTVNGIDAAIVEKIYSWIYTNGNRLTGRPAAQVLIERQSAAVDALLNAGIVVKINSVIVPGVNDSHIGAVAETMAARGVDVHNCIPLIPTVNTVFGNLSEPSSELIHRVRSEAGAWLPQMSHCSRCRADACGLLGEKGGGVAHFDHLNLLARETIWNSGQENPDFIGTTYTGTHIFDQPNKTPNNQQRRRNMSIKSVLCLLLLAASLALFLPKMTHACASCGCTLSSDWNTLNISSPGDFKIDLRYDYLNQDQLRSGTGTISSVAASKIVNNGDPQEVEKYTVNNYLTLGFAYSVTPYIGVSAQLPWIFRNHSTLGTASDGITPGDGGGQYNSKTSSIGDIKLLANYQGILPQSTLGVVLGFKLPSGSFNQSGNSTDTSAPGPVPIDRGLQPGTGTTDIIAGLYYADAFNIAWSYFAQAQFQAALDSRDAYRPGNAVNVNLGVRFQAVRWIAPQLQINAKYGLHDEGANADAVSTGGTLVYVSPGVVVPLGKQASVYAFGQVPVYQNLNGVQLAPMFTISAGAKFAF